MGGALGTDLDTVVADALGISRDQVSDDLGYGDISQWDSLRHVNLMLVLEDEFGLAIGEGEAAKLVSVGAIRDYLNGSPRPHHADPAMTESPSIRANPELNGVTMTRTEISDIDEEGAQLRYRGYDIADLADRCTFEETAYCLLYGDLPQPEHLEEFSDSVAAERDLSDGLARLLGSHRGEPIAGVLSAALATDAAWGGFATFEELAIAVLGRLPTIVATHAALADGRPTPVPDPQLGHAANTLFMLKGGRPGEAEVKALDALFVTQAEHGLAASTLAARVAIGVHADVRPAIVAAVNTWFGRLHAGAVTEAMGIQAAISSRRDAEELARRWRAGEGRPYGFGHPVYRGEDPRASVLRATAQQLSDALGNPGPLNQADLLVEAVSAEWRGALEPNFDSYAATIYRLLRIPSSHAVGLFTCARVVGWLAHIAEQQSNNHLIRPRLRYAGAAPREVPGKEAG